MRLAFVFAQVCLVLALGFGAVRPVSARADSVVRYALLVNHEHGWPGEKKLRYTQQDVQALSGVLNHKGNFHIHRLRNPSAQQLSLKLLRLRVLFRRVKDKGRRVHFLFYYSGHADREFLHLGPKSREPKRRMRLKQLAKLLHLLPISVKVIVLDTCYAGALIEMMGGRTKGRRPERARFFPIAPSVEKVTAVLASSVSQSIEAKRLSGGRLIEKSLFTHYFVEALYGKADRKGHGYGNGDGKVSISEAFAYTRAKTIRAARGLQDPTRYLEIKGHQAFPLTTFHQAQLSLYVKRGDLLLFSSAEHGVLLRIKAGKPATKNFTLLAGPYRISLMRANGLCYRAVISLKQGLGIHQLSQRLFQRVICPRLSFWSQKGPKRVAQTVKVKISEDISTELSQQKERRWHLFLGAAGGDVTSSVVPPLWGGQFGIGVESSWWTWQLWLSFQLGSRLDHQSYFPEVVTAWGKEFRLRHWRVFLGPMLGVGVLVVDLGAEKGVVSGTSVRFGASTQLSLALSQRWGIVLSGFGGGAVSQQRSLEGVGWQASFAFRVGLGFVLSL